MDTNKDIQDLLDDYVLGILNEEEKRNVEEYLQSSPESQKQLEEAKEVLDVLHSLPGIEPQGGYAERILKPKERKRKKKRYTHFVTFVFLGTSFVLILFAWQLLVSYAQYPQHHLDLLEKAIWRYNFIHGHFPNPTSSNLGEALEKSLGSGHTFRIDSQGHILDAWGEKYRYICPGKHNSFFDLYSVGKNQIDENGQGDDVKNWKDR